MLCECNFSLIQQQWIWCRTTLAEGFRQCALMEYCQISCNWPEEFWHRYFLRFSLMICPAQLSICSRIFLLTKCNYISHFWEWKIQINADMYAVSMWARANKLDLNAKKFQGVVIRVGGIDFRSLIWLNGVSIPFYTKVKNLGLTIGNDFKWVEHAELIQSKIFAGLRSLWQISRSTLLKMLKCGKWIPSLRTIFW